jgi:quinol monooxygenase YgiN
MTYVVVATYRAQVDTIDQVKDHLQQMVAPTRAEPGCHTYQVLRSRQDDDVFVLVEEYEDERAFEAHRATDHFDTHILQGAIPLLAEREVVHAAPLA